MDAKIKAKEAKLISLNKDVPESIGRGTHQYPRWTFDYVRENEWFGDYNQFQDNYQTNEGEYLSTHSFIVMLETRAPIHLVPSTWSHKESQTALRNTPTKHPILHPKGNTPPILTMQTTYPSREFQLLFYLQQDIYVMIWTRKKRTVTCKINPTQTKIKTEMSIFHIILKLLLRIYSLVY